LSFAPAAHSSVLFSDSFQNDLSQWTAGGGVISAAPDGHNALSFNRTWGNGDIFTNNSFSSSKGSFTLSFDLMGNCGATSGCGAFVGAFGSISYYDPATWIVSDTPYAQTAQAPDSTDKTWNRVSLTFASTNARLMLEDWQGSPNAAPHSFFMRNLVLTDNPTNVAVGTLTVSPVPEAEEWAMMLLGLPLMGWVARHRKIA
jgi:hypothetical protein